MKALLKFAVCPRVADGEPVEVKCVRNMTSFVFD